MGSMTGRIAFGTLLACTWMLAGSLAEAQAVRISKDKISPQTAVSSLTVSVSPATVNFNLVSGGISTGSNPIALTTTWGGSLCLLTCTINLYAYFADANAALSGGSPAVNIPSSEVLGQVTTGTPTTFTPFTQTNPVGSAGASLKLFQQSSFLYWGGGSRTDALNLQIDLSSQPQLPAGTYSGTLFIQAQSL